jgi:hypothetical protein
MALCHILNQLYAGVKIWFVDKERLKFDRCDHATVNSFQINDGRLEISISYREHVYRYNGRKQRDCKTSLNSLCRKLSGGANCSWTRYLRVRTDKLANTRIWRQYLFHRFYQTLAEITELWSVNKKENILYLFPTVPYNCEGCCMTPIALEEKPDISGFIDNCEPIAPDVTHWSPII